MLKTNKLRQWVNIALCIGACCLLTSFTFAEETGGTLIAFDGQTISTIQVSDERYDLLLEGGKYLPPEMLNKARVYTDVDPEEGIVSISDGLNLVRYYPSLKMKRVNGVEEAYNAPIKQVGTEVFVSSDEISKIFKVQIAKIPSKKKIIVFNNKENYKLGQVSQSQTLSSEARTGVETSNKIKANTNFYASSPQNGWIKVITDTLEVGYIPDKTIIKWTEKRPGKYAPVSRKQKVNLTWEYVYSKTVNPTTIGTLPGVNAIAPTWYNLQLETGTYKGKESAAYIRWANEKGYELWPTVNNQMNKDLTRKFIYSANAREKFIEGLLGTYQNMGYKGINIDFENMYKEDVNQYTQFISELTARFRQAGIIVSVDVTVPGGADTWSKCYERYALGQLADYIVVMTYDEFYASSPVAGSVASYGWVEKHMTNLVKTVPPQKLIMGMPLYMRVWTETPPKNPNEKMKLTSSAIGMTTMKDIIAQKQLTPIWDEKAKQYYATYTDLNSEGVEVVKKVWIEDASSISEKVKIANQLGLAGVATWRRGYETPDIWTTIQNTLNQ